MIRVGVVGASGWASGTHLPALVRLPQFRVTAVATTNRASAERVAAEHGVSHALTDAAALAAHPEVDLVVVSVKAPAHAEVITAALEHGKHVVSEWPLGVDVDQARELAAAADAAGVRHAVVLQGHHSPDARFVADLLADGRIGRLEAAVMVADGDPFGGATIPAELAWTLDPAGGTSILPIMAGHFLATLERIAGPLTEVSARLPGAGEPVRIAGTTEDVVNRNPRHVLLQGRLAGGAETSVAVLGGDRPSRVGFSIRLVGTGGTLAIAPRRRGEYLHWTDWDIDLDGEAVAVPDAYRTAPPGIPPGPATRIAALYQEFARALAEQRRPRPDFADAVRQHAVLAAIRRSAASGTLERIAVDWIRGRPTGEQRSSVVPGGAPSSAPGPVRGG
ncbi:Gfo/Idh/MocA family protein [Embleya sp. NPDC059259]|uniref:Gfo/Idh/MocA family protein n=1 Tax=unclassified Embleya TaxID=2699296 RepID=UPI0036B9A276